MAMIWLRVCPTEILFGQEKVNTLKTQVVVTPGGVIIDVSDTVPASQHDKSLGR
jgi:hypothetical protein